jgi:APA family basic amino acid/polyamine antiporter
VPNRQTRGVAMWATTAVSMILTMTGGLASLAETVVLLLLFVFLSTNIAVIVLRKDKVEEKHFRAPIILPYLAIASCVLLLTQQDATVWLRAGILMGVGLLLFGARFLSKGKNLGSQSK